MPLVFNIWGGFILQTELGLMVGRVMIIQIGRNKNPHGCRVGNKCVLTVEL